jgi:hypothetical protein
MVQKPLVGSNESIGEMSEVFNLQVENDHRYFVTDQHTGADGAILVHNFCRSFRTFLGLARQRLPNYQAHQLRLLWQDYRDRNVLGFPGYAEVGDSGVLRANMIKDGTTFPTNTEAHHLISSEVVEDNRAFFEQIGFETNHPSNGIPLPNGPGVVGGAAVHNGPHVG